MNLTQLTRFGVTYYACNDPAWNGVHHGFSTRLGGVSAAPFDSLNLGANRGDLPAHVIENFHRFQEAIGATRGDPIVKNHQVHGRIVRQVTEKDVLPDSSFSGNADADALVTNCTGLCLTVFSADCVPILYYDPHRRVIGAAHAGWRGTAKNIAGETVRIMVEHYGCLPSNILCAIGAGIGACCFETHSDVPDALRLTLGKQAESVIHPLPSGKFLVDLKQANANLLHHAGISANHLAISNLCTACHPNLFWSHRILGNARGSMAAMIQLSAESLSL